jgi:hypothetical protein
VHCAHSWCTVLAKGYWPLHQECAVLTLGALAHALIGFSCVYIPSKLKFCLYCKERDLYLCVVLKGNNWQWCRICLDVRYRKEMHILFILKYLSFFNSILY